MQIIQILQILNQEFDLKEQFALTLSDFSFLEQADSTTYFKLLSILELFCLQHAILYDPRVKLDQEEHSLLKRRYTDNSKKIKQICSGIKKIIEDKRDITADIPEFDAYSPAVELKTPKRINQLPHQRKLGGGGGILLQSNYYSDQAGERYVGMVNNCIDEKSAVVANKVVINDRALANSKRQLKAKVEQVTLATNLIEELYAIALTKGFYDITNFQE